MRYNLSRKIDELAPERGRISTDRDHFATDVLFKGFIKEKGNKHGVIEGRVLAESLKRKLFKSKILEGPMDQFIPTALMVPGNDCLRLHEPLAPAGTKAVGNDGVNTQIGINHRIGTLKIEDKLAVFIKRPAIKSPSESFPASTPVPHLHVFPYLNLILMATPEAPIGVFYIGLDIIVELTAADVAHVDFFQIIKELLIEIARIHPDDDRNIRPISLSDRRDHTTHHLAGLLRVIAVAIPGAKNGIYDKARPCHLNRLISFDFFISRLHPLALEGFIVIHDHTVDAKVNHLRLDQVEAPQEKLHQNLSKPISNCDVHRFEKPLDRMRGKHATRICLNATGIALIGLKSIEIEQMAACSIHKKAKQLFENFRDHLSLRALSQFPEKLFKAAQNTDRAEITDKEGKACAAGENILGDPDLVNFVVVFRTFSGILVHETSHLMGFDGVVLETFRQPLYITFLPVSGSFF